MISVKHVTSSVVVDLLQRQPLSAGKVRFAWEAAAGPALARATTVDLDRDGTIVVRAATAAWAREVERSRELLLSRLRRMLGPEVAIGLSVRVA